MFYILVGYFFKSSFRKRVPDNPDSSAHMPLESEPSMTDFDSDVHNDDDHSFIQRKKRRKHSNEDIPSAIAAIDEKKFIVFESCLEKLASLSPQKRCKQCNGTVIKQRRQNGTALHIKCVSILNISKQYKQILSSGKEVNS